MYYQNRCIVCSADVFVCLKRVIFEGLLLTYNLCCCFVSRGDSVSASHSGHSTRSSGDTSTVTWDYSDSELSGLFHGLHRIVFWVQINLTGFKSLGLNLTHCQNKLCVHTQSD